MLLKSFGFLINKFKLLNTRLLSRFSSHDERSLPLPGRNCCPAQYHECGAFQPATMPSGRLRHESVRRLLRLHPPPHKPEIRRRCQTVGNPGLAAAKQYANTVGEVELRSGKIADAAPGSFSDCMILFPLARGKSRIRADRLKRGGRRANSSLTGTCASRAANRTARIGRNASRVGSALSVCPARSISDPSRNPPFASHPHTARRPFSRARRMPSTT